MNEMVVERIATCLRAGLQYNPNAAVPPVALLWPDPGAQWQPIIDRLSDDLPIISLGQYEPAARRGPAYWLRCVVAGTVEVGLPKGPPILYLPGVARLALRAVDACPADLAPIAELQYRSQWFTHPSGRDWSVRALLSHAERGIGLDIAEDAETSSALLMALDNLLDERVDALATQVLDAGYFHDLINPDPVRSLLGWLDDPPGFRSRLDVAQWTTFVQQCRANFNFNPALDGEVTAARRLGERKGSWANVWKRYAETPGLFPGIPGRLRQGKPMELFVEPSPAWPQDNDAGEGQLRNVLADFEVITAEGARKQIYGLEQEHAWRRRTVWAGLDLAPLAFALEQLVAVADLTKQPLASENLQALTKDYAERGWRADDAVVRALAAARAPADRSAVGAAAAAIYRPWLDAGARALQARIGPMANAHTYVPGGPASTTKGTVSLFVDGLRLDIAHRVSERLSSMGFEVDATTSLSALPTVTQTAKPALVPTAEGALVAGPDLHPANIATGTTASIQVLRSLMANNGVQVLMPGATGDPTGTAWAEAGELDHRGHDVGVRLVDYLDEELDRIVSRIRELLDAGWLRVEVLTDHGWVLLPGGLEKVDLAPAATEVKKGRCARLKEGAVVAVPTVPWFWDQDVRIALAPGITCFEANKEYEHGGVSPQECIVPRLTVTMSESTKAAGTPEITSVKWLGMLCRIEIAGINIGVVVDLRALPADPTTSIAEEAKQTSGAGRVSLVVPDEDLAGEPAYVVLVAPDAQVLAQRNVIVGRNR